MLEYNGPTPIVTRTDFEWRLHDLDARFTMPEMLGWTLFFREYRSTEGRPDESLWVIQIGDTEGVDNVTGQPMQWRGRRWIISPHMSDGEVARTVFLALMTAVEHESREQLLFDGVAIFDPHFDLDTLVAYGRTKHHHETEDSPEAVLTAIK